MNEVLYRERVRTIAGAAVLDCVGAALLHAEMLVSMKRRLGVGVGRRWAYAKPPADLLAELRARTARRSETMPSAPTNREYRLVRRPDGIPRDGDFALVPAPIPAVGAGEFLIRSDDLSAYPSQQRCRMALNRRSYGSTIRSLAPPSGLGRWAESSRRGTKRGPKAPWSRACWAGRSTRSRAVTPSGAPTPPGCGESTRRGRRYRRRSARSACRASPRISRCSRFPTRARTRPSS